MAYEKLKMAARKRIALIAHNARKEDILEWVKFNKDLLGRHILLGTKTTGDLISKEIGLEITTLKSGPLGGDQQIGSRIAEGEIDFLIFFWDPLESHPHDPDVKALLRIAVLYNIPVACNRASADFMVSSSLMTQEYERPIIDYISKIKRHAPSSD
ncbi:MAG: methylglyoxal synthase [bacterium]